MQVVPRLLPVWRYYLWAYIHRLWSAYGWSWLIVALQVLSFNGKPVKNLKGLATMVENCDDEFLQFDLDYDQVSSPLRSLISDLIPITLSSACTDFPLLPCSPRWENLKNSSMHKLSYLYALTWLSDPLIINPNGGMCTYYFVQIVVLETKTARAATLEILTTHCIPAAMSDDLRAWTYPAK